MRKSILFIFLTLFIFSCIKDDDHLPSVEKSTISLVLTDLEDDTGDYQDRLIEIETDVRFQTPFFQVTEDSVVIEKRANFQLSSENAYNPKYISLHLFKKEAKRNLTYDSYFKKWKYNSANDELRLFYQSFDEAVIDVSVNFNYGTLTLERLSEGFKINKFNKVLVNGNEEWSIEAVFSGIASGHFFGEEPSDLFEIKNGNFVGVLN